MAKFLYANFLDNKRTYNLAQGSWKRLLNSILKQHGYTFQSYINQKQNGKKEYDGNPIFSAYVPEIKRAIRVIQVSPEEEGDDLSAWIDDIDLSEKLAAGQTKELVLDLKLSKQTKNDARELIQQWVNQQLSAATLNREPV